MVKIDSLDEPIINSLEELSEEILSHASQAYGFMCNYYWGKSAHGSAPRSTQAYYRRLLMLGEDGFKFPIFVAGPYLWAIHNSRKERIVPECILCDASWYKDLTKKDYSCMNIFEALKTGNISEERVKQLFQENSFKNWDATYFMGKNGIYDIQLCPTPIGKYEFNRYKMGLYTATEIRPIPYQK